jgi:ABC-2 type transport system ATP-binding protein
LRADHVVAFAVADPERLPPHPELAALPGVTSVRRDGGQVELGTSEVHRLVPALLDALRARALSLTLLTTHSATLEDVFVTLTGRHLRDE